MFRNSSQKTSSLSLQDYVFLPQVNHSQEIISPAVKQAQLLSHYRCQAWPEFFALAMRQGKNIVVSGRTSSGKTTFLTACLQAISITERLVILEDTREINIAQPNQLSLLTSVTTSDVTGINMQQLLQCALRLRPDRIILGEMRGKEVLDFIAACNTGHAGSLTTLHAGSIQQAFARMLQMYKLNNVPAMQEHEISQQLRDTIDIIVQLSDPSCGQRGIIEVYYRGD